LLEYEKGGKGRTDRRRDGEDKSARRGEERADWKNCIVSLQEKKFSKSKKKGDEKNWGA